MGAPWRASPSWSVVERLSAVSGRDIDHLLCAAGAGELKVTGNAQLATFALSLVILDALHAARPDLQPSAVAGHSLGEYAALVAAGVLTADDGTRVVAERGDAMGAAADANPGTMAAVLGLDAETVALACADADEAWVANDNAPGQIVIAGSPAGIEKASAAAKDRGAKRVIPLAVSGAFHTPLMGPAQERLDAALAAAAFAEPSITCVANVDALAHDAAGDWSRLLSEQLTSPVRWRQSLILLGHLGITAFVELGPGTELSGMVKRTVDGALRANVAVPDDLAKLPASAHTR